MSQRVSLKSTIVPALLTLACLTSKAVAQDLTSLRTCARDLSINVEGDRFKEGFASDTEDSMYFITCDDNPNEGKDHYIFTVNGIWHLFEKAHYDYKGGLEPTTYRFIIGTETFYFRSNIVGEMGDIFNAKGVNLSTAEGISTAKIDISPKNQALAFYIKTLTGKKDPKGALIAEPISRERTLKLQECVRQKLDYLGTSLAHTYRARADDSSIDPILLAQYRNNVTRALSNQACHTDAEISSKFEQLLANLP